MQIAFRPLRCPHFMAPAMPQKLWGPRYGDLIEAVCWVGQKSISLRFQVGWRKAPTQFPASRLRAGVGWTATRRRGALLEPNSEIEKSSGRPTRSSRDVRFSQLGVSCGDDQHLGIEDLLRTTSTRGNLWPVGSRSLGPAPPSSPFSRKPLDGAGSKSSRCRPCGNGSAKSTHSRSII